MWAKKYKLLFVLMFLFAIGLLSFTLLQEISKIKIDWIATFLSGCITVAMTATAIVGVLLIVSLIGTPLSANRIHKCLANVGFTDKAGETPLLLSRYREGKAEVFRFYSPTIPLSEYEKRKNVLENALNFQVVSVAVEDDLQHIVIKTVPAKVKLPDKIDWNNDMLSKKTNEFVLGESVLDVVKVDIDTTPHILIGGSTGSGKSVLFKLILAQSILKGYYTYVADFKGGIEFSGVWKRKCEVISNARISMTQARENLLKRLDFLEKEMKERNTLFEENGCLNITQYNNKFGCDMQRILFACDEIAEILDRTGLDKDSKDIIAQIESKLSNIARQGRAYGIHLLIATQRPDSEIVKGQIKSNFSYRICGWADDILSKIVLDSSDAAEKVPKDKQGVFLTNDGVLFKAYYLDEDKVF